MLLDFVTKGLELLKNVSLVSIDRRKPRRVVPVAVGLGDKLVNGHIALVLLLFHNLLLPSDLLLPQEGI